MTALLNPRTADRLAKLCGMFGSDHDGERAAAALKADQLVRAHGLRWGEVISPVLVKAPSTAWTSTTADNIAFALRNIGALSMWERGFLYSVRSKHKLSDKQLAVLEQIVAKAKAYAETCT
jgi:hypothetical protein